MNYPISFPIKTQQTRGQARGEAIRPKKEAEKPKRAETLW